MAHLGQSTRVAPKAHHPSGQLAVDRLAELEPLTPCDVGEVFRSRIPEVVQGAVLILDSPWAVPVTKDALTGATADDLLVLRMVQDVVALCLRDGQHQEVEVRGPTLKPLEHGIQPSHDAANIQPRSVLASEHQSLLAPDRAIGANQPLNRIDEADAPATIVAVSRRHLEGDLVAHLAHLDGAIAENPRCLASLAVIHHGHFALKPGEVGLGEALLDLVDELLVQDETVVLAGDAQGVGDAVDFPAGRPERSGVAFDVQRLHGHGEREVRGVGNSRTSHSSFVFLSAFQTQGSVLCTVNPAPPNRETIKQGP